MLPTWEGRKKGRMVRRKDGRKEGRQAGKQAGLCLAVHAKVVVKGEVM